MGGKAIVLRAEHNSARKMHIKVNCTFDVAFPLKRIRLHLIGVVSEDFGKFYADALCPAARHLPASSRLRKFIFAESASHFHELWFIFIESINMLAVAFNHESEYFVYISKYCEISCTSADNCFQFECACARFDSHLNRCALDLKNHTFDHRTQHREWVAPFEGGKKILFDFLDWQAVSRKIGKF